MKTPIIITGPCEVLTDFYGEDGTKAVRLPDGTHVTLALGREIAKKVLTWQDVRQIVMIAADLDPLYNPDALDAEFQSEEALYTEVLKRFQEGKL